MQPITIQRPITTANLCFSEYYLSKLHKWSFNKDSWITGDKFIKFTADMLTFCLLNLILTKKIVSGYEIKTTNILGLFKLKETHYYFSCGTILPEHEIGYIEQKIVDLIRANPGLMHQKLIGKLVKQWHNRDFYLNMGKYIIVNVLNHQKLNFFETNKTYCFPSVHINIDISPQFDPKPLEEITKAIMCELDQNPILSKLNLDLNKFFKTTIWSESGD